MLALRINNIILEGIKAEFPKYNTCVFTDQIQAKKGKLTLNG